jgi:hypothetical protein
MIPTHLVSALYIKPQSSEITLLKVIGGSLDLYGIAKTATKSIKVLCGLSTAMLTFSLKLILPEVKFALGLVTSL